MNMRSRSLPSILAAALMVLGNPALGGLPRAPRVPAADTLVSLLLSNSFREADRLASRLLVDPGLAPGVRAVCGLALLKVGRIEDAEAVFQDVLKSVPDNPEAHLGLGRIACIRNDGDAAVESLRRAVSSAAFRDEAFRLLWRAAWDRGRTDELSRIRTQAKEIYRRESKSLPAFFSNGWPPVGGLSGRGLFRMEGTFERIRMPLAVSSGHPRIRMIRLKLNGKTEYPFHIDSALAGFMTLSPLLAEELGLVQTGSYSSIGVGTAPIATRFSMLDRVDLGPVSFRDVPVMVSDLRTFRGLKGGLIGTALLKRFNATIDARAGNLELFPLDRPDLFRAGIDKTAVAADLPLLIFDQTVIRASVAGAPPALYILDTAAAAHLIDGAFSDDYVRPKIDPARIVRAGIQGAGGAQFVNLIEGLDIVLGPLVFKSQPVHEFNMAALNEVGGRYAAGLIGNPLLWPYRVHMDFRAGRLILEKYSGSPSGRDAR